MPVGGFAIEEELLRYVRGLTAARFAAIASGDYARARVLGRERRFHIDLLRQAVPGRRAVRAA